MTTITFYAYQTDSSTTSTITHVIVRIWDGPPAQPGSTVVFGDTTTNLLTNTLWSGIYRVTETTTGTATNRPIMANIVNVNMHLDQGTYWLDWQTGTQETSARFVGQAGYEYQFRVRAADRVGNLGEWATGSLAAVQAATDGATCGNREGGAAAHRPALVRLCGSARAGDRGDSCGRDEQQENQETF